MATLQVQKKEKERNRRKRIRRRRSTRLYLLSFVHQVPPPRYTNSRLWCSVAWPTTSSLAYKKTTETTATSLIAKMCSSKPINQRWSPRKSPHLSHPSPCSLPTLSLLSSSKCKLIICCRYLLSKGETDDNSKVYMADTYDQGTFCVAQVCYISFLHFISFLSLHIPYCL